jgi:hypothetical protein
VANTLALSVPLHIGKRAFDRLSLGDSAYTLQTCSSCCVVCAESRENQAVFRCVVCGFESHADANAAMNILRRNTALMCVEEGHWLSVETRTRKTASLS